MNIAVYVERCLQELAEGMERVQAAAARAVPAAAGFPGATPGSTPTPGGFSVEADLRFDVEFATDGAGKVDFVVRPGPLGGERDMFSFRASVYVRSPEELVLLGSIDLGRDFGEALGRIRDGLDSVVDLGENPADAVAKAQDVREDLDEARSKLVELTTLKGSLPPVGQLALAAMARSAKPEVDRLSSAANAIPGVAGEIGQVSGDIEAAIGALAT